jgi:hypothetical protein
MSWRGVYPDIDTISRISYRVTVTATCRLTDASQGGLAISAHRRWAVSFLALSLLLALAAPPLAAQTVDEIIKRGKVIVGVDTTTPIFGLAGPDGQPEGYDPAGRQPYRRVSVLIGPCRCSLTQRSTGC